MTNYIKIDFSATRSLVVFNTSLYKLDIIVEFANELEYLETILEVSEDAKYDMIQDRIEDVENILKNLGTQWTSNTGTII